MKKKKKKAKQLRSNRRGKRRKKRLSCDFFFLLLLATAISMASYRMIGMQMAFYSSSFYILLKFRPIDGWLALVNN